MRFTRRAVLGASSLLLARRSWADAERLAAVLPAPDFGALREKNPYVIGVRPHRKGGVRLELEDGLLDGKKHVIHNYGHGGGGITLSLGSASVAADLFEKAKGKREAPSVAILGTGVMGLTTATELKRRWPKLPLTVYAKDVALESTTSFIAGGQFEPSGIFHEYEGDEPKKVFATYLRKSKERIVELEKAGAWSKLGITTRKDYTLDHTNRALDEFTPSDVIAPFRSGRLPFEKLDVVGREYDTWLLNPTLLLPALKADLVERGVAFEARTFESRKDVADLKQDVVINCTGLGAKTIFSDNNLVPQRGHLVVLKKTKPEHTYFFSGGCSNPVIAYCFCRQDDIVLGGTVHGGEDALAHGPKDPKVFKGIVSNLSTLLGGAPDKCRDPG